MIPRRIAGTTHVLGPPKGWDEERNGSCYSLAVRVTQDGRIASAWEPTPAELKALNEGGSVILSIVGVQPPVWISVEEPETGKPVESAP